MGILPYKLGKLLNVPSHYSHGTATVTKLHEAPAICPLDSYPLWKCQLLHHDSQYPPVPGELCLVTLIVFLLASYMMKHLLISSEYPLEHLC